MLLLAGCGSGAASSTAVPTIPDGTATGSAAVAAAPAGLPKGPPLVAPGERMSYKLSLQGVELASYAIAVDKPQQLAGKPVILVQSHAKAVGFVNMVAAIDDRFTSWIDLQTGRSLRFQADEYASGSKTDVEHAIIDLAGRTGDSVPCTFGMNDATPTPEPQKVNKPETWDFNAFMVALRSWEAPVGSAISLEVFRSRYLWNIDAKIAGKEQLSTALGELPALRIDATTYKLTREGVRDPGSDERKFSLWISDDGGRVPLAITARTDYGDIKMEIVDYDPGTAAQ